MSEHEPVPRPVPEIEITPGRRNPMMLTARCVGVTDDYTISMGEGTRKGVYPNGSPVTVIYPEPGMYFIRAYDATGTLASKQVMLHSKTVTTVQVSIAATGDRPGEYAVTRAADGTDAATRHTINWDGLAADGQNLDHVWLGPGKAHRKILNIGQSGTVVVHDEQSYLLPASKKVTVAEPAEYDPAFTLTRDPNDKDRMSVVLTFTTVQAKPVVIDWGEIDGSPQKVTNPKAGDQVKHAYTEQPHYTMTAYYEDGSGNEQSMIVTIPWPDDE